jgi:hypothetical protein
VGGALASWGPRVQLARSVDVTTSHTTAMGSWEAHSDVGLVSAGEDTSWGVLSPVVGGLLWEVPGANGVTAGEYLLSFAP